MTDYINFKDSKSLLFNKLFNYRSNMNNINNNTLFDFFKFLYMFNKNILKKLICESLNLNWYDNKSISDIFNIDFKDHNYEVPDIFVKINNNHYIIDISISFDVEKTESDKKQKYGFILNILETMDIKTQFIHINVKSTNINLSEEISKLTKIIQQNFDLTYFMEIKEIIEQNNQWITEKIDKEFFNQKKLEYFEKT